MSKKKSNRRNKRSESVTQTAQAQTPQKMKSVEKISPARGENSILFFILSAGLLSIPIGFFPTGSGEYNASFFAVVFLAVVLAVGLMWAVLRKTISIVYTPFFAAIGVWLAAKLLTTSTSILPYHSFWGTYKEWSDGFMFAFSISVIAGAVLMLKLNNKRIARLVGLLSFEAVALAAITVGQAINQGFFYQKVRPNTPLGNADYFISYSMLFLPVLIALLIAYILKRQWYRVAIASVGSLVLLMGLFVSMPTHLQTILLPAFENGKVDTTSTTQESKSISATNFTQDESNTERWSEWKFGLQFGLNRPFVGTGPSTTMQAFQAAEAHDSIDLRTWNDTNVMNRSHNDLIEQFSQEGLVGLIAYIALLATFIVIIVRRRRLIESSMRPLALGLAVGLTLWFIFNQLLFTTVFSGVIVAVWVAFLLTIVGSTKSAEGRKPLILLATVTVVIVVTGIWIGVYYVEDSLVNGAINASRQLSTQTAGSSPSDIHNSLENIALTNANAANMIKSEPYYSEQAAFSYLYAATQALNSDPADAQSEANESLHYAKLMLASDLNSPEYLDVAGNIEYLISPMGSAQSQDGLNDVNKAIKLAPNEVSLYSSVAANAIGREDYITARKYIALGLAAPSNPVFNKQPLRNLESKLPAQ